jgi:hypothetical protein
LGWFAGAAIEPSVRWANIEVQPGSQFMWKAYPAMGAFSNFPRSGLNLRCTRAFADLGDGLPSPLVPVQTIESEPVTVSRLAIKTI